MNERRTISLRFAETSPRERLTLRLQAGRSGPVEIEIAAQGAQLHPNGDALFALGYLPACELQYDLRIEGEVSPELLAKAGEIFKLYAGWYGYRRQPQVHAQGRTKPAASAARTLLFFSGGVDSCYSLVEAHQSLHSLVTIVGADLRPEHHEGAKWLTEVTHRCAEQFALQHVILHTGARQWFDRMVAWNDFHGPFLAAMAHLLSPEHGRALVAGTYGAGGLAMPWGSHPEHEHRYASPAMSIEHHLPHTRLVKLRRLVETDLVRHLRVCLKPIRNMNCGVCNKCTYLRTVLRLFDRDVATAGVAFARWDRGQPQLRHLGSIESWSAVLALAKAQGDTETSAEIAQAFRALEARQAWRRRLHLPNIKDGLKRIKRRTRARVGTLFRGRN